jgi:hypothetical protein
MADNEEKISAIELLAYDMVNGFTQIGRHNPNPSYNDTLLDCCTIPTTSLTKNGNPNKGNGVNVVDGSYTNAYQINAIESYVQSQKDTNPVRINPNYICTTHRLKYFPKD